MQKYESFSFSANSKAQFSKNYNKKPVQNVCTGHLVFFDL